MVRARLFKGITPADALGALCAMLELLGVERCREFRTHDFRRGHAEDLRLSGAVRVAALVRCAASWWQVRLCGKFWRRGSGGPPLSSST